MYFTLFYSVSFLDFCCRLGNGLGGVYFRRTGSSPDTVSAGTSTNQDYNVSRPRILANHVGCRGCRNNGTQFHAFSFKTGMIYFCHLSCCKTDLISVRTESRCSFSGKLHLRKFSLPGFRKRPSRIGSPGNSQSLIYPRPTGKRITDSTTDTSSGTTERFYLCRMIVGFVFEHQQPFFCSRLRMSIFHIDIYRTRIDFFRNFHMVH